MQFGNKRADLRKQQADSKDCNVLKIPKSTEEKQKAYDFADFSSKNQRSKQSDNVKRIKFKNCSLPSYSIPILRFAKKTYQPFSRKYFF